jgi:hypothetical protein
LGSPTDRRRTDDGDTITFDAPQGFAEEARERW